jgi:hypothetical protein
MEPDGSSPYTQQPATCPYPEPDQSSLRPPHPTSRRYILILSSHLRLGLPSDLLPSGSHTKAMYAPLLSPISATCPGKILNIYENYFNRVKVLAKCILLILKQVFTSKMHLTSPRHQSPVLTGLIQILVSHILTLFTSCLFIT